jgi:chromosomal replication initiator protein
MPAPAPRSTDGYAHQPGLFGDEPVIRQQSHAPPRAAEALDAHAVWQKLLGEMQLQLEPNAYHTWLHDTWVEGYEDGEFFIGTPNTYARDWLANRLRPLVRKTLKSIVGRNVDVKFLVRTREVKESNGGAPLYEHAAQRAGEATPTHTVAAVQDAALGAGAANVRIRQETSRRFAGVQTQLNPMHTFDAYVVGNSNRFAYAAAQAVAEKPGFKFNPLFVYGGVGLGKTHLLHAIGNDLVRNGHNVLYCTSEQFTNDLISAIRSQTTEQFRNKYRELDVLLIDDIQFIAGKESTQEEFFHTFNHLQASGRQVVMSSDRPPKALQQLEERLRSRFEGGIQVDVSAPDFETRVAILQTKAARMGIQVSIEVLKLIAERVDSNIRELEGALNHLFLQAQLSRSVLDIAMATDSLNNVAPQRKPCSPPKVVALVAQHYTLEMEELTGSRRTKPIADARHIATYLLREDLGMSLPQIGALMGGRDHTTIAHGIDKINAELRLNEKMRHDVAVLREKIYTPFIG